jgi:hypothetical protein
MMSKPADHPGFAVLLKEWNLKLAESGFKDIENSNHLDGVYLRESGSVMRMRRAAPVVRDAKTQYFNIIGQSIARTQFDDEQEKKIMCLYFEGYKQEQIRHQFNPPIHRSTVYRKLYKWLKRWGLK